MQKEEKNFRSYYDEAEEESHDYFDINDCYDYEGNFDYDRLEDAIMVAKTEHSHPLERFNPFTIEP